MKQSILSTLVVLVLALSACTSSQTITQGSKGRDRHMVAEPDPVALRLAAAVDKASAALTTLASVEQAREPGAVIQMAPQAPQELRRIMSVEWVGPIETITRRVAERAGYKFQVTGDMPPAPLVVNVTAAEKTVIDILRDIGMQAGTRADIVVNAEQKIIEVSYASVAGG